MSNEEELREFPEDTKVITNDGQEHSVQQPPPIQEPQTLKVGIVGDNALARATDIAFDNKGVERLHIKDDNLDELIAWKPTLTFVCGDIPLMKNDTLNDAQLIDTVNRLVRQCDSGICIRSTLNIETLERLILSLTFDAFNAKIAYMPEFGNPEDIGSVLQSDFQCVGGEDKAVGALLDILKHTSHFSSRQIVTGSVFEVAYTKLAVAGFKAVKQTFFNQLFDTILDVKNANPTIVRRMIEKSPEMTDTTCMIPTYIRCQTDEDLSYKQQRANSGEFENSCVRMLVGMTDKLSILDECVNYKNLR